MQFHLRKHLPILWQEKLSNCSSTKETDSGRIKCLTPSLFRERGWAHFNSISSLLATSRSGSVTNGIKNRVFFFFASTTWQTLTKVDENILKKIASKEASKLWNLSKPVWSAFKSPQNVIFQNFVCLLSTIYRNLSFKTPPPSISLQSCWLPFSFKCHLDSGTTWLDSSTINFT